MVAASDNKRLLPFSRDYLFASVHDSCRHRRSAVDDATYLTQTIISELVRAQHSGVISLADIARAAHTVLHRFDPTAATVYAAYHPLALAADNTTS
jgi:transcriptional regulator NrdR family protein